MMETATPSSRFQHRPRSSADLIRSWDAFDRLFEEAFAPGPPPAPSQYRDSQSTLAPLSPIGGQTPFTPAAEDPLSSADEDFNQLWNEAASRRRRVTRTVTRRRTLRQGTMSPGPGAMAESESKAVRRKSRFHYHRNGDPDTITATFELPDVRKEDVHVAFQFDRLTITWESVITTEKRETDRTLLRERKERKYARTLPLPPGTQFDDVKAFLEDGRLTVTYPKFPTTPMLHSPLHPLAVR